MISDPSKFNQYWFKIFQVMQYGPKYFREFKKLIDQASLDSEKETEVERRK